MDYIKTIKKYANKPDGLINALHILQSQYGYLPEESIAEIAREFGISCQEAYGVATFYSLFSVSPRAQNIIRICASAPCYIAGMTEIIAALKGELGIKINENTPDMKFRLELCECVGQCQGTPVITINGKPYLNVTPAQIPGILDKYRDDRVIPLQN